MFNIRIAGKNKKDKIVAIPVSLEMKLVGASLDAQGEEGGMSRVSQEP